ncbi:hypothetical protein [Bradyrhizobium zhanjiangense]|uniref:hypothetical protein n=1 Tax=Bradyrhizobium zhanjiangense TaxID=1325107 RepID=UPI0013E8EFBA|nr:hypothetical protein [Bradyrhizobium zhanjiangense]
MPRFTDRYVASLKAQGTERFEVKDDACKGLAIRVTASQRPSASASCAVGQISDLWGAWLALAGKEIARWRIEANRPRTSSRSPG